MKKLASAFLLSLGAVLLAGCGGGGGATTMVATADLTAPVTASSVPAVSGESFAFSSGVPSFGTTTTTTVQITSTSTFAVSSADGTASGNLTFGSCIFTVTASTYVAPHPLAMGGVVTVNPCNIVVDTSGLAAEQNAVARAVSFVLAGNASLANQITVDIQSDGTVIVDGVNVGDVTLSPVTGGS